jgi:hypothetical protein
MANSLWRKPELLAGWEISLRSGLSEFSNWIAKNTYWFK